MVEKSYLQFIDAPTKTKTTVLVILSRRTAKQLGVIKFNPQWRQFVFFPDNMTIWSDGCLEEIKWQIRRLNFEWHKSLKEVSPHKG